MLHVLTLDIAGTPFAWLEPEEALRYYALGKVSWELGDEAMVFRGGVSRAGVRSVLRVRPIIAVSGSEIMASVLRQAMPLGERDNDLLFRRDHHTCAYCGRQLHRHLLTRDHIVPRSRGGKNTWTNCVTACRGCNQSKGSKPVDQFRPLMYVPYMPCRFEHFILSGRNVIADQHDYLSAKLPRHSRFRRH